MLSRDSISQTGQFFNRILPKYSRIPLLFTVVLNFSVYWGARAIAGGFIHHNIETSLDDMIPVVYPTVVIYFGCYIFWIIGYLYNAAMDKGTVIVSSWQTGWQRQSVLSVMSCILQPTPARK